jgi:outer membrane protein assembly factor BamB
VNTPVIDGGHIYGICSYGQFRCLRLSTGERVWETLAVTKEKARWASGFIVRNGDRYFINNDRGELIIARLSPKGYEEISRTALIKPTSNPGNRRELVNVNWSHPAYANRHIVARNDEEIVRYTLARD